MWHNCGISANHKQWEKQTLLGRRTVIITHVHNVAFDVSTEHSRVSRIKCYSPSQFTASVHLPWWLLMFRETLLLLHQCNVGSIFTLAQIYIKCNYTCCELRWFLELLSGNDVDSGLLNYPCFGITCFYINKVYSYHLEVNWWLT